MAYIEKSAFEARITNNRNDDTINVAGLYQESNANADCSAGLLVKAVEQADCEGFTGVKNENTWIMNKATSSENAGSVVYACNTYETKLVDGKYYIGRETLGLGTPAGRYGNFTKIVFDGDHHYRFGVGNTSGTIGTNKYFTIDAGLLKTAASAPTDNGAIYFELVGTGKFIEGNRESFEYYDVIAKTVYSAIAAPSA